MKFEKYSIVPQIKENLKELGFYRTTDIQFKAIGAIMSGSDLLAIAQTGTGKTAAFVIPIIDKIERQKKSKRTNGIKTIVLVPTRELSQQIGKVFKQISKGTNVKSYALYGGVEQDQQIKSIQNGIDILITTPGRMFDLINQKVINVDAVDTLVLDEADHMLKLNFIDDIKYIKKMLKRKHQTLFFSATINSEIKKLASSQVKGDAVRIEISPKDPVSKNVTHSVMFIDMDDKRFFLQRFIEENSESKVIVFVRTKVRAERVHKFLNNVGITSFTLHSDRTQKERLEIIENFRNSESGILIATDISARGIDIPNVNFVINYDLPEVTENYVHRVGRTGRAFNKGEAISFCSDKERELLEEIENFVGKKITPIKVNKKDYKRIVEEVQQEEPSYLDLLKEYDELEQRKKKASKGKKKKKK